jgi:ornithine carbamoyltransferase
VTADRTGTDSSRPSAHFLSLLAWTRDDLDTILERAREIVASPERASPLAGKTVFLLWATAPDRTREDFSRALDHAGCHRGEPSCVPPPEGGHPLAGADVAVCRFEQHSQIVGINRYTPVPVVNAGTNNTDPFRVLAEIFGLERLGVEVDRAGIVWWGGPGPRLNSWLEAAVRFGFSLDVRLPVGTELDPALTAYVRTRARGSVSISVSDSEAARGQVFLFSDEKLYNSAIGVDTVIGIGPGRPPQWDADTDRAVAQGVLEEVWVRTARARAGQE